MALIVYVEHAGEAVRGLVREWSADARRAHVTIDEVPRQPGLHLHDVVAVELATSGAARAATAAAPLALQAVIERGPYGAAIVGRHQLAAGALDAELDQLEIEGWATRAHDDGTVSLAPITTMVDPRGRLARLPWLTLLP